MKLAVYDKKTGEIDRCITGRGLARQQQLTPDLGVAEVKDEANANEYFINLDTQNANLRDTTPATPSKTRVTADGVDHIVISQMRDQTTLAITGPAEARTTISGDNASETVRFTSPGVYTVTATGPFPLRPKEIVIHAD